MRLITLILILLLGAPLMADEQPINRRDLRRQIERLHEELLRLQKQVETLTKNKGMMRPAPNFDALQTANLPDLMQPIDQTLADLTFAINRLQKREQPGNRENSEAKPSKTHRRTVTASDSTYRIQASEGITNRSITIANVGSDMVTNPRLIVNDQRNWYSTPDILNEIITPNMTDREKALAIWRFLVDNRYHGYPAHNDIEVHDPVRFLNVYGYGFCDDAATNFMVLSEQAGVKARVWGLSGHVVPEAYFEDAWHMLDPDGQIYYLDDDGYTISSIATLEQRPDIIRKYPSPFYTSAQKLIDIYCTTEDNQISEHYREKSEAVHTLSFTLRPGESLTRHHENWGRYFSSRYLSEPKRYGNGTFVFEPIFENSIFKKGATSVRNLKAERADNTWILTSTTQTGTLIYPFNSPYPYLDGHITLKGKGHIALAFSETGDNWTDIWTSDTDTTHTTVPIGGYFRNGHGRPTYAYSLKLTINGQIDRLRFQNDVQVAPQSLPTLEPGKNTVRYIDETNGEQPVRIGFGYDLEPVK